MEGFPTTGAAEDEVVYLGTVVLVRSGILTTRARHAIFDELLDQDPQPPLLGLSRQNQSYDLRRHDACQPSAVVRAITRPAHCWTSGSVR